MGTTVKRYSIDKVDRIKLSKFDPAARPFSVGDAAADKVRAAELAQLLARAQDRFYARKQSKLLLVLQGMDTSGKDGSIRSVFQCVDPLGVRAVSYRAPTEPEKERDFLWRHHRDVPGNGEIVIFNRSHYEAVLVEYVHRQITDAERERRFAHIRAFERLLTDTGTTIIKCFLHISREEQGRRLQERIDDPNKQWKFNPNDLSERKLWPQYQKAYQTMLSCTGSKQAPWFVVPADSKTHRNLMLLELVLAALQRLAPSYPPPQPALKKLRVD